MSLVSMRGFAVVSATAVTAVGSVVGVASAGTARPSEGAQASLEANPNATLLADLAPGGQAPARTNSVAAQAEAQAGAADAVALRSAERAARTAAAEHATARQAAARKHSEDAAAARSGEEDRRAAGSGTTDTAAQGAYTVAQIQAMAARTVPSGQFQCFSNIVAHESSWNMYAVNAASGAYGLFQALPGSKMSSAGADWRTNPATQIKWGLGYMNAAYGSPCDAWTFWQANHWY